MKTRHSTLAAAFIAWSLLAAKTASAVTIVFTLSGNLTGTIGNTTLNGNAFHFALTRDTSRGDFSVASSTSISIAGVGAGSFSNIMNFNCASGSGSIIQNIGIPFTVVAFTGSGLNGWNCLSPIGPVAVSQSNPSSWTSTQTSLGVLAITGISNATFSAAAPNGFTITTNPTLPAGAAGIFYSQSLTVSGNSPVYVWSVIAGALPQGLSLSGSGAISGTPTSAGTLSFTVMVTDGASASAIQAFSLTIGTALTYTSAFRVPQIVDGGGWSTRLSIINTDRVPVSFTFQFWGDDGGALNFPILNQTTGVLSGTLAPGASFFAQSPGIASALQQGWAEVASSGRIGVTGIFQFSIGSPRDSLGSAVATLSGNSFLMPFDNTQGNVTAVAIANTNATQPLTVTTQYETDGGAQSSVAMVIPPHSHRAFVVPASNPAVAGFRGSILFTAPSADIAVMGLEFTPAGAFTSLGAFQ